MTDLVALGAFEACSDVLAWQKYAVPLSLLTDLAFVASLLFRFAVVFVQLAFVSEAAA